MVASSVVCSWLVAACMSIACEKDQPMMNPSSMLQSSPAKRWSRWSRKRRLSSVQCRADLSKGLVSSFCGSGNRIQGLMSSYLAFEPCDEYYSSKGGCSSDFFGDNGFASLFGSKNVMVGRRRRRVNRAVHSGEAMAVAVQPAKEVTRRKKPPTTHRRVVVTGMGVQSPVGHDPDVFYNNLLEGRLLNEILIADFLTQRIAGEIKSFSTDGWVAPKLSKRMDKFMVYMLTAGKKALADGGITEDVFNDAIEALRISYRKMNPFCVPFATTNMGSAMLAMDLGWMGPNYSISTACATSNFCILNAANHIIRGEADMMLCGGSDAVIIPIGLGGFVACRALSQRNSDPAKASRPWDINRDGFVMGEGAGVLLLEELDHAKKRGANIYAEFLGGSFTCDAYHMTEPHPEGQVKKCSIVTFYGIDRWVSKKLVHEVKWNMESKDGDGDIDCLERGLLSENGSRDDCEAEDKAVFYTASFEENEENFVKYQTAKWVLYSLLLILAWGIGLFMLIYLPVRRYILRKDIRSRKLYVTPNAIVYKVIRPVPFPCFGVLKKEKYVLLPSVADVVIEQVRIENIGLQRSPSDDVQIQGVANPRAFRKAVMTRLSNMRSEAFSRQVSTIEDVPNLRIGHSAAVLMSPSKSFKYDSFAHSGELILLQKLEEVGTSVKRVQSLIEEQHPKKSGPTD
ncbi:fatty acid biosynthesis 1 [Actinidia rufa]|uniref:beta-ketoacyl-[acyl-carrier-protein] synthase I n=1 Tax=Actinidia rufa TaxID=165716 RepID=A0A7J0FK73_9ERIC|nr:fatty acid biosynthesis 1 [Actinidia rufa]